MPFPPISLHQRITSPGRDLFRKKKPGVVVVVPPPPPPADAKPADKDKFPRSWPAANLRSLGRKSSSSSPQQQKQQKKNQSPVRTPVVAQAAAASAAAQGHRGKCSWLPVSRSQDSCGAVTRSSSAESGAPVRGGGGSPGPADGEKEVRFSLSLTPEAILVIQKRNLEKQMMAKQHKCCVSATDVRHRRIFPSKKAHQHHHHHQPHHHQGGSSKSSGHPVARPEGDAEQEDITAIVKISLLNDRYKYDDVEYEEEEDGDAVDETVVRKCKEWLKGVESAAAAFGKVEKLCALPHLKGC